MGKFDWCAVIEKQWCNLWKRQNVLSLQSVAALKKAETTLRHKYLAVLPTAKSQKSHYVIIENIIMKHNH